MSDNNTTVKEVEIDDLDALLNGADNIMLPSAGTESKNSLFSRNPKDELNFLNGDMSAEERATKAAADKLAAEEAAKPKPELNEDGTPKVDTDGNPVMKKATPATPADPAELEDILNTELDDDPSKGGRKKLDKDGLVEFATSLIEKKLLVPFEDDKDIKDYTMKDFEELFQANMEEKERKIQAKVPEEFFKSLPEQLQYAAHYAANGGTDLKGLFRSLAAVEEVRDLDPSNEVDAKNIVRTYLQATKFGDADEIEEEIDGWADRNELEAKASKFKPKLDAMSEQQVQYKIQQQEATRAKQAEQAQLYMDNVYKTLEPADLNGLKLDKKTQNNLFTGLVQPNYQSVSGKPTNLLGHLLEKYQFVEPNHALVAEALWLLSDPEGYKTKVKEVTQKQVVGDTVRKLKTAEKDKNASYTNDDEADDKRKAAGKKPGLQRPSSGGFFKR